MDISLTTGSPTDDAEGLTEGGFYSVLTSCGSGKIRVAVEAGTGDWKQVAVLGDAELISITSLPGTKIRFTLEGAATGTARVTEAA
jgi:hypothetical protein